MTNQQAIEIIKRLTVGLGENGYVLKANAMAIEALEKQIPKQPIIENLSPAICPTCGKRLSEDLGDGYYQHWESLEYCDCGQKLKWEEGGDWDECDNNE